MWRRRKKSTLSLSLKETFSLGLVLQASQLQRQKSFLLLLVLFQNLQNYKTKGENGNIFGVGSSVRIGARVQRTLNSFLLACLSATQKNKDHLCTTFPQSVGSQNRRNFYPGYFRPAQKDAVRSVRPSVSTNSYVLALAFPRIKSLVWLAERRIFALFGQLPSKLLLGSNMDETACRFSCLNSILVVKIVRASVESNRAGKRFLPCAWS